jgi:hypothetical protein
VHVAGDVNPVGSSLDVCSHAVAVCVVALGLLSRELRTSVEEVVCIGGGLLLATFAVATT